jgi:hypothetical protein
MLASLSGLIAVVDGLAPGSLDYDAGDGDVVAPAFEGVNGLDAMAFLLGTDLGFELIPAVVVDGPFGPIEVTPAITLGSLLEGEVGNQSSFTVDFGEGIEPADLSQAHDGDNLVFTIDNGDGTTNTLTLEDVYADGNTSELAVNFADGTALNLSDIPETIEGDDVVSGTEGDETIDAAYLDADGDTVTETDDLIVAGTGNDTMAGGAGNDIFDGGEGTDTVQIEGTWDTFEFNTDTELTLTTSMNDSSAFQTDVLISIEQVLFSDGSSVGISETNDTVTLTENSAAGVRTSITQVDTGNTRTWDTIVTSYGADGTTLTDQVFNYDDGRVLDRDYDANGVKTSQTMTDGANAHAWASYTQTFAADGTLLSTVYVDDMTFV